MHDVHRQFGAARSASSKTALTTNDLIGASVLSGNRNFEARIHQSVKANFLMSPPLVVAFAIAGRIDIDLTREPLAVIDGREVYLRDVWPSMQEIDALLESAFDPIEYRRVYADFADQNPLWNQIPAADRASSTNGTRRRCTSASRRTSIRP